MPLCASQSASPSDPTVRVLGTTTLIELHGELGQRAGRRLRDLADDVFDREPESVVLDLDEVVDCDADGIEVVREFAAQAHQRRVRLVILASDLSLRDGAGGPELSSGRLVPLDSAVVTPAGGPDISWRTVLSRSLGC